MTRVEFQAKPAALSVTYQPTAADKDKTAPEINNQLVAKASDAERKLGALVKVAAYEPDSRPAASNLKVEVDYRVLISESVVSRWDRAPLVDLTSANDYKALKQEFDDLNKRLQQEGAAPKMLADGSTATTAPPTWQTGAAPSGAPANGATAGAVFNVPPVANNGLVPVQVTRVDGVQQVYWMRPENVEIARGDVVMARPGPIFRAGAAQAAKAAVIGAVVGGVVAAAVEATQQAANENRFANGETNKIQDRWQAAKNVGGAAFQGGAMGGGLGGVGAVLGKVGFTGAGRLSGALGGLVVAGQAAHDAYKWSNGEMSGKQVVRNATANALTAAVGVAFMCALGPVGAVFAGLAWLGVDSQLQIGKRIGDAILPHTQDEVRQQIEKQLKGLLTRLKEVSERLLGVDDQLSDADVKHRLRRIQFTYHPDTIVNRLKLLELEEHCKALSMMATEAYAWLMAARGKMVTIEDLSGGAGDQPWALENDIPQLSQAAPPSPAASDRSSASTVSPPLTATKLEVVKWLEARGLHYYFDELDVLGYDDMATFKHMTPPQVEDMVSRVDALTEKPGHKTKFSQHITALKANTSPPPPAADNARFREWLEGLNEATVRLLEALGYDDLDVFKYMTPHQMDDMKRHLTEVPPGHQLKLQHRIESLQGSAQA